MWTKVLTRITDFELVVLQDCDMHASSMVPEVLTLTHQHEYDPTINQPTIHNIHKIHNQKITTNQLRNNYTYTLHVEIKNIPHTHTYTKSKLHCKLANGRLTGSYLCIIISKVQNTINNNSIITIDMYESGRNASICCTRDIKQNKV